MSILNKIKAKLNHQKFEQAELADGQGTVINGAEGEFAPGDPAMLLTPEGDSVVLPDGEYALADGRTLMVAEGVITEVGQAAEAMEDKPEDEAMSAVMSRIAALEEKLSKADKLDELEARLAKVEEVLGSTEVEQAVEALAEELSKLKKQPETKPVHKAKSQAFKDIKAKGYDPRTAVARNLEKYA